MSFGGEELDNFYPKRMNEYPDLVGNEDLRKRMCFVQFVDFAGEQFKISELALRIPDHQV